MILILRAIFKEIYNNDNSNAYSSEYYEFIDLVNDDASDKFKQISDAANIDSDSVFSILQSLTQFLVNYNNTDWNKQNVISQLNINKYTQLIQSDFITNIYKRIPVSCITLHDKHCAQNKICYRVIPI